MATKQDLKGNPNYAIPPGQTLLDTLEEIGMTQAELSRRMGRPIKTINEIIKGKAEITPITAIELERATGVPATLWNNLEKNYREKLALLKERARLENQTDFLRRIPLLPMTKMGWIEKKADKIDQLHEVLSFFRISTVEAWEAIWGGNLENRVAFRKAVANKSDPFSLSAWLNKGEIEATNITCNPYNKSVFKSLLQNEIRNLTRTQDPQVFLPKLTEICSNVGVAVVIVKELPGCSVNGATYWLNPEKAVIQLSLRYRSDDHLWFNFFHEAGHIVLHGKRETFLEYGHNPLDKEEQEANKFSADTLIPHDEYVQFCQTPIITKTHIVRYAEKIGISPGIVLGRLQHDERVPFRTVLNELKVRYVWTK